MPVSTHNCPFYGRQMTFAFHEPDLALLVMPTVVGERPDFAPFHLVNTNGNQCALVLDAHSPCQEEIAGREINWATCPLVNGKLMLL